MQRKLRGLIHHSVCGLIRGFITFIMLAAAIPAQAALECDQVIVVAQAAIKLRDDGMSLNAVIRDMENSDLQQKLDAKEINLLCQIVRLSYTSETSLREIAETCNAGELGLPKPKPKP
jgi:hypothetical protein